MCPMLEKALETPSCTSPLGVRTIPEQHTACPFNTFFLQKIPELKPCRESRIITFIVHPSKCAPSRTSNFTPSRPDLLARGQGASHLEYLHIANVRLCYRRLLEKAQGPYSLLRPSLVLPMCDG